MHLLIDCFYSLLTINLHAFLVSLDFLNWSVQFSAEHGYIRDRTSKELYESWKVFLTTRCFKWINKYDFCSNLSLYEAIKKQQQQKYGPGQDCVLWILRIEFSIKVCYMSKTSFLQPFRTGSFIFFLWITKTGSFISEFWMKIKENGLNDK